MRWAGYVTLTGQTINAYRILVGKIGIGPPLWSSGQSSRLQIQRPRFDSRLYEIF
jgi:hypothetical protein